MSRPLQDFRGKITLEAHAALQAEQYATGRDQAEIAREVLHEWALRKIDSAKVLHRLLRTEGAAGEAEGSAGKGRDSKGSRGSRS